ncbi:hypothetical protein [Nocardiopsis sp. NPDC006832]|uniref:hypothetical protein n=1 Tax=Nocardiopsis sp. NPDC006832 TaxID=3157188 RepID=UPI0033D91408
MGVAVKESSQGTRTSGSENARVPGPVADGRPITFEPQAPEHVRALGFGPDHRARVGEGIAARDRYTVGAPAISGPPN